jgi:hypothetical protein
MTNLYSCFKVYYPNFLIDGKPIWFRDFSARASDLPLRNFKSSKRLEDIFLDVKVKKGVGWRYKPTEF